MFMLGGSYARWQDVDRGAWDVRYPDFTPEEIACKGTSSVQVDEHALDMLQALRTAVAIPMHILSGYPSESYNCTVGGAKHSMHLRGQAFDVHVASHNPAEFEDAARRIGFTGFGFYPGSNFIHIDNREKPAEWGKRWWR